MTCAVDPGRCPLCGETNACARVVDPNAEDCWCTTRRISPELLLCVPKSAQGRACICQNCVEHADVTKGNLTGDEI